MPYVFGIRDLLIHFDLVQATCMHLLNKFPPPNIVPGAEVIVHAEVLRMEPGTDYYVVASTKRIALFKARLEGGGPVVHALVWQLLVHDGVTIKSSIESRGHNGIALYVMSSSLPDRILGRRLLTELDMELQDDLMLQQGQPRSSGRTPSAASFATTSNVGNEDSVGDEETRPTPMANNEQSFFATAQVKTKTAAKAIAKGAGAKFTVPRSSQNSNVPGGESMRNSVRGPMIDQHMILGEFQHRQALIRVHNAICCLAKRFDLIMWEGGVGVPGSLDMYTTFGHLIFEEEGDGQSDRGRRNGEDEIKPGSVSFESISEGIAWLHDVDTMGLESDRRHLPVMSIISRNEWLYADELDSSRREGGPNWWIEARARSTFVPPPSPPIPAHVDHDDSVIADIMRRLETGAITYDQAVEEIRTRVAEIDDAEANQNEEEEELIGDLAACAPSDSDESGSPQHLHTPPSAPLLEPHLPEFVNQQDGRTGGMMLTPLVAGNDTRSLQSASYAHGSRAGLSDERIDRLVTTMERFLVAVAAGSQIGTPPAMLPRQEQGGNINDGGNVEADMASVGTEVASVASTLVTNSSHVAFLMQEVAALREQVSLTRGK